MLNIVIPMAGAGSRFSEAGYSTPKPLITIKGVPMIQLVTNNLRPNGPHRFIYVCQKSHLESYNLYPLLLKWGGVGCEVVAIDGLTEGAACTVLAARDLIDSVDNPLMIANSDQWVDICIDDYLCEMYRSGNDGFIMTMSASDPKWSFVGFDDHGFVQRVVEKEVISSEATVGIYNFKRGHDFVISAETMISKGVRVKGEFYVAPTYNNLIASGKHVGVYNIGEVGNGMHCLGTPEDLEQFLQTPVIARVIGQ